MNFSNWATLEQVMTIVIEIAQSHNSRKLFPPSAICIAFTITSIMIEMATNYHDGLPKVVAICQDPLPNHGRDLFDYLHWWMAG